MNMFLILGYKIESLYATTMLMDYSSIIYIISGFNVFFIELSPLN